MFMGKKWSTENDEIGGRSVTSGSVIFGIVILVCAVVALSTDVPLWAVIVTVAAAIASAALAFFIRSRFTEEGRAARLAAEGLTAGDQHRKGRLKSRTLTYAAVAIGSLLTGLQVFLNPEPEGGQGLGASSLLVAAVFGFLALREHRGGRVEPDLSLNGNPLAALSAPPTKLAPTKPAPIGSPTTTLIVIAIFVILLVIADVRMILMPSGPNDIWIGVGQMVIWLPVFGYLAYREFRRMKAKQSQPEK